MKIHGGRIRTTAMMIAGIAWLAWGGVGADAAEFRVTEESVIVTTGKEDGAKALATPDDFTAVLTDFDRAARMNSATIPTAEEYLKFVSEQALPWSEEDVARLTPLFAAIRKEFEGFKLPLPSRILLIQSTGKEEGGASYCRGPNVVIPKSVVQGSAEELQDTLTHELFHILSKSNPKLRQSLYAMIGFEPCGEVIMPVELKNRLITNPDAPRPHHFTRLMIEGSEIRATPVLYSRVERFDPTAGGSFFSVLEIRFMVIEPGEKESVPVMRDGKPWMVDKKLLGEFRKRMGPGAGPIPQPEEILASYFPPLVHSHGEGMPEEILKAMNLVLKK